MIVVTSESEIAEAREGLCIKCAKDGHTTSQYKNVAFCVICNKVGHQTYSIKCEEVRWTNNENPSIQHK